jgi:iron only hydrogenase large subunit-like protein
VLLFGRAYGFRNIQRIVMSMKRNKSPYHFVEIMACPSGCLNGGGQIKPAETTQARELIAQVGATFHQRQIRRPEENPIVAELYSTQLQEPGSQAAKELLHTRYHTVPKTELANPLGIQW